MAKKLNWTRWAGILGVIGGVVLAVAGFFGFNLLSISQNLWGSAHIVAGILGTSVVVYIVNELNR